MQLTKQSKLHLCLGTSCFVSVAWFSVFFSACVWIHVYLCSAMHDAVPTTTDIVLAVFHDTHKHIQKHTYTHRPPMDRLKTISSFSGHWAYFTHCYLRQSAPHHKRGPVPIQQLTRTTNWRSHCPCSSAPVTKLIVVVNQHNCSFPLTTNPVHPHSGRGYLLR